jgi:glycosyltransferase involved in cell wall biosynthesis
MRVLLVSPRFAPEIGGLETHVLLLAERLATAGVEVTVLTTSDRSLPRRESMTTSGGARFQVVRARRPRWQHPEIPPLSLPWDVMRLSQHSDIVHVHSYHRLAALVGVVFATRPLVATFHYHGTGHNRLRRFYHRLYLPVGRWMVARCRRVIAVSAAESRLLERDFSRQLSVPPTIIPNGTDPLRPAESFATTEPVVLSVCRLEPYKEVATLVEARRHATRPWRLVVVGDGPERAHLRGLDVPGVEVLGRVSDDDLARWWATADLVVSASREEAFGLTVASALSAGRRCLASDIPAHRELVELAGCGRLLAGHDAQVWAAAIEEMLSTAPPAAGTLPDWAEVAHRTQALYREVLR